MTERLFGRQSLFRLFCALRTLKRENQRSIWQFFETANQWSWCLADISKILNILHGCAGLTKLSLFSSLSIDSDVTTKTQSSLYSLEMRFYIFQHFLCSCDKKQLEEKMVRWRLVVRELDCMGGSRGGGDRGSGPPPPLKNHKNIGFYLAILVQKLWKTKPAFNVGPSSARQRNVI